jgi:hypothetical protein
MSDNNASALAALQKSGTLPGGNSKSNSHKINREEKQREIINGVKTITPIVSHLIKKDQLEQQGAFSELMDDIKLLQHQILVKAADSNYNITPRHYVAINRLAMHIICSTEYECSNVTSDDIASWCMQLFDMDDIYSDSMLGEYTDDDFALQFMAVSKLSASITKHIIGINSNTEQDDAIAELMTATIERVDAHIDAIYEQFIAPTSSLNIRSHLIHQSAEIIAAILEKDKVNNTQTLNIPLINKKFDIAYSSYIEAITLRAETRD